LSSLVRFVSARGRKKLLTIGSGNRGQTTLSFNGEFAGLWPDNEGATFVNVHQSKMLIWFDVDHSNYDDGSWDNSWFVASQEARLVLTT